MNEWAKPAWASTVVPFIEYVHFTLLEPLIDLMNCLRSVRYNIKRVFISFQSLLSTMPTESPFPVPSQLQPPQTSRNESSLGN